MIEPFLDHTNTLRRCGSLIAEALTSALAFAEDSPGFRMLDKSDILKLIRDPNRTPCRRIFGGPSWAVNQYSTSACNGWAWANMLTRCRLLRGIKDGKVFAGSYIYSHINGGRDNGSVIADGERIIEQFGCATMASCDYSRIWRKQTKQFDAEAEQFKGLDALRVRSLEALQSALAQRWMAVVAVHAGPKYDRLTNGISGVQDGPGNHAVCVQDLVWHQGRMVYDQANSWGLSWGDGGFTYLTDEHLVRTMANHNIYVMRGTKELAL